MNRLACTLTCGKYVFEFSKKVEENKETREERNKGKRQQGKKETREKRNKGKKKRREKGNKRIRKQ